MCVRLLYQIDINTDTNYIQSQTETTEQILS